MSDLTDAAMSLLSCIDSGAVSIDTQSPTTRQLVTDLRKAMQSELAEQQAARSARSIRSEANEITAFDAARLREELIRIRNTAMSTPGCMGDSVVLTRTIAFVYSAALMLWQIDITEQRLD